MQAWPVLSAANTRLVALNSGPMGQFLARTKDWERRSHKCHEQFVVFCSNKKDSKFFMDIPSNAAIEPNHAYLLVELDEQTPVPNTRYYDWTFKRMFYFLPPVDMCGDVVGQGVPRPTKKHKHLMNELNRRLAQTVQHTQMNDGASPLRTAGSEAGAHTHPQTHRHTHTHTHTQLAFP